MQWRKLKRLLLGNTLETTALEGEKLGRFWGVPIMSSDAVSSVAYAIEEMLLVLVPVLGLSAPGYLGYVVLPITLLFLVLAFSYSQIISGYPNGGGAYVVSAENIGHKASLVAASALIVDYVMTVAVSISAAIAALVAAFPVMQHYRLPIALGFLCIITLLNLRGMRESSKVFGIPTYAFIFIMGLLLITGLVRLVTGNLPPVSYEGQALSGAGLGGSITLFLFLRAFASGCSALTGVEVVSNAVPSFREPSQHNAKIVLFILVGIIVSIFGGSALLVTHLGIIPTEGATVISQMGMAIFGAGPLFYILQFATSVILLLAANTAYNGLPTLLAILAGDGYMPRQFMQRGTRLSFSNGILFIFFAAGLLLIIFQADTHHLIPMYAVGAFLSFTLGQGGMVLRWKRQKGKGYRHKMIINAIGAIMTAIGTVVVFTTKFTQGAWALAIIIPTISILMYRVQKHYDFVNRQLKVDNFMSHYHPSTSQDSGLFVVLAGSMNRSVLKALNYANLLSSNVVALHVSTEDDQGEKLRQEWETSGIDVPLVVVHSPYRDLVTPVEEYVSAREAELSPGDVLTVVLSRFVEIHWFDNFLHNQTAYFLSQQLKTHRNVATVSVPYLYNPKFQPKSKTEA